MDQEHELFLQAAEQLQELKLELEQQQAASTRLQELVSGVDRLAGAIGKLPTELGTVVQKAEQVEQRLLVAVREVEGLRQSIPEIVQKIEESDYGKSIASLLSEVATARDDLQGIRESAAAVRDAADLVRASSSSLANEVNAGLLRISESQVNLLHGVQSLNARIDTKFGDVLSKMEQMSAKQGADATAAITGFSHVSGAMRSIAERQVQIAKDHKSLLSDLKATDITAIKSLLVSVNEKLDSHAQLLDGLAKKKGFFGR